jgi:hypothetical protein
LGFFGVKSHFSARIYLHRDDFFFVSVGAGTAAVIPMLILRDTSEIINMSLIVIMGHP